MKPVLLNERYRLLELIGSGGTAVVYKATDTLLQRRVAVKVLREGFATDPAFLARFRREAQAAAELVHPNIITVYDVGHDGDLHFIVMEYVDGQDLKTLVRQKGRLSVFQTLDVAIQVCAGAGYAHKAGVIHCDIKPQNVLVTWDGRAKVADFGIARALSELALTESETVWGSPLYFSPEQAAGEPPSPASDVYSIGVVIYEMLAGAPPFQAENSTALALMHMREDPPPLRVRNPQVAPGLEWIVRKVLAKEPSARYRTADQLAHVLEEYRRRGEELTGQQPATLERVPAAPSSRDYAPRVEAARAPGMAFDWTTTLLAAIAFIAVVGLIPLWWLVYQSYSGLPSLPPSPTPEPLVTLTTEAELVAVPDVVGRPVDEAGMVLQSAGLRYAVEERDDPGVEAGVVLEQSPSADTPVSAGTQVSLVVSRLDRDLVMPHLVDYQLDLVQNHLKEDGLLVVVDRVWSARPEGVIVGQEPESGTMIHANDTVTLTVSGSADTPIQLKVNLAGLIELTSADFQQKTFQPGGALVVTLHWRALSAVRTDYVVFVHLIDAGDPGRHPVAQGDERPVVPTTEWAPGIEVVDPHQFAIPAGQPSGVYQVRVGMYPEGQPGSRLRVVDAGLTTVDSDSILIAEVEVRL